MRLKIRKKLRTSSLNSKFPGSYKSQECKANDWLEFKLRWWYLAWVQSRGCGLLKRYCLRSVLLKKWELPDVIKRCPKPCSTIPLICKGRFNLFDSIWFWIFCNYILFAMLPWPEDSKGTFWFSSQAATSPLVYHTWWWRLHTVPFDAKRLARKRWMTIFIVFDLTRSAIESRSTI